VAGVPQLRASDADRTSVEATLRVAYTQGRLMLDELEERLEQTGKALTSDELERVVADLDPPAPRRPAPLPATRDGRATASLVLGVVGLVLPVGLFVVPILAIALGATARRAVRQDPGRTGKGAAEAGIACGAVALVLHAVLLGVWLAGGFG